MTRSMLSKFRLKINNLDNDMRYLTTYVLFSKIHHIGIVGTAKLDFLWDNSTAMQIVNSKL